MNVPTGWQKRIPELSERLHYRDVKPIHKELGHKQVLCDFCDRPMTWTGSDFYCGLNPYCEQFGVCPPPKATL